jgi:hypothetical protein
MSNAGGRTAHPRTRFGAVDSACESSALHDVYAPAERVRARSWCSVACDDTRASALQLPGAFVLVAPRADKRCN